jgi:hypothetical protein
VRRAVRTVVLALASWSRLAGADGVVTRQGAVVATAPHTGSASDESTDLARALSGLAYGVATTEVGGERAGDRTARGVTAGATLEGISAVYPFGAVTVARLSAWYQPDHQTARLHATVADIDALFTCRDAAGALHAPLFGHSRVECVPGGGIGVGGALVDVAWDPASGRVAARWGEVLAVVDLTRRASAMSYLTGHVDLALGVDAESVWHGRDDARTGSDHLARGVIRAAGLIRSASARWDASLTLAARPAIAGTVRALHDVGTIAEGRVRHNTLVGASSAISIGVLVHAAYWSDPSTSDPGLDAVARRTSLFAGVVVEARHESPR